MGRFGFRVLSMVGLLATLHCASSSGSAQRPDVAAARDLDQAAVAEQHEWEPQKGEFLAIAHGLAAGANPYFGRDPIVKLQRALESSDLPMSDRAMAHGRLALELTRIGEIDDAVRHVEQSRQLLESDPSLAHLMTGLHRIRALVYLRQAEIENCIGRHNADCCIFPLKDGGVHEQRTPAQHSMTSFLHLLEADPTDLRVRWLVNLVSMALGEYPGGVPAEQRIPPEVFDSDDDIGRFRDIAPELGVDTFDMCGGSVVDDLDGDGLLDIVTSSSDPAAPLRYYRNTGRGGFEDRSAASRLDDQLGGLNCLGADYDNDGDLDLLVLRGAWLHDDGQIRNSLVNNNGDGTFTDVTRRAGLADPARPTQAAVWADYDNDGDLDLYVVNESRAAVDDPAGDYPSQLFRNDGDGTFSDVAADAGVTNDRFAKGVAAGDYDNDGDVDLYVSNIGPNRLYRNEGDGTFADVAPSLGVTQPDKRSFATWFFDHDNDGDLDLFVAAYDARVADVAADYLSLPGQASPPALYRNDGDGTFTDIARTSGLNHAWLPMGAGFGDLDNDGWLDFYLATGDPDFQTLMPNVMLRNDGGRRFLDVTTSGGFGHLQKGHGVSFADLDNDGDQDIYHQLGGFYPGDRFANALFHNPGHGNRFLVLNLRGVESNRSAYGARIAVTVETAAGRRTIHRAVGSVSSFGGTPRRQEIGLGDARRVERVEVFWPRSGTLQQFDDVPLDSAIEIREGTDRWHRLEHKAIRLDVR